MRVFLPYVEVLWKQMPASLKEIKSAGFDGIECHLIGRLRSQKRLTEVCKEAVNLGLGFHLHQGWSWKTGQPGLYNSALRAMGALVPADMPLGDQIPDIGYPAVVYGNHLNNQLGRSDFRYQTASEYSVPGYAAPFEKFAAAAVERSLPVVFDTQHILEWSLGVPGVEELPSMSQAIGDLVTSLWKQLYLQVVEIHLCDFDPKLGRSHGRNVFPGTGIFPLDEFCAMVRKSRWSGVVVPEVAMQHLHGMRKLQMLRDKVSQVFGL